MVERLLCKQDVSGSSPLTSITNDTACPVNDLVWQAGICTATCTSEGVTIYKMIVVNGILPGA